MNAKSEIDFKADMALPSTGGSTTLSVTGIARVEAVMQPD
jgi:hypothetical protein